MKDQAWSWCPQCKRWVPASEMNYDFDENGKLIRVCNFCLDGVVHDEFVYEERGGL